MTEDFDDVVRALHAGGVAHDAVQTDRARRRLQPDAAALLRWSGRRWARPGSWRSGRRPATLHAVAGPRRQRPGRHGGQRRRLGRRPGGSGLDPVPGRLQQHVQLRCADGGEALRRLPDGSEDVVFLDSDRSRYPDWWPHPVRVLREGGLLAVDDVLSHPGEVADLLALVEADPRLRSTVSTAGKGLLLAARRRTAR